MTYEEHIAAVKVTTIDEDYEVNYFEVAEALLFNPAFKALAKKRFPAIRTETALTEAVAESIY